jgi:D-alanyl-D-alanine carboxypeptidase
VNIRQPLLAFAIAFLTIACIPSERSSCSGAERDAEQVVVARDNHGRELLLVSRQGHLMTRETARAFDRLAAHASRDGVRLVIRSGYRSYAQQVVVAQRFGLYDRGGRAARPGTSPHGRGNALDLDDGRGYRWLARVAPLYGFRRTVPREPWHFAFQGPPATATTDEPEERPAGWPFVTQ